MKLHELEIGKQYTIPLVAINITQRETRAKKQYLALELFDGIDKINGNYWDWNGKNIPDKNAILDVRAQVVEWQGAKQLNILGMATNSTLCLNDFMPSSGYDVSTIYKDMYELLSDLQDDFLRALCLDILESLQHLWLHAPAATGIHHAYIAGTLIHSLSVAKLSKAIAELIQGANVDLATAGGFLHDIGKLFGYKLDGIVSEMTDEGKLFDHLFIGAEFVGNFAKDLDHKNLAKLQMLRHIILSHHGKQETGAIVPPMSLEAHIVYHADTLDAISEIIREASRKVDKAKWTERLWALQNKEHLSIGYTQAVMSK